MFTPKKRPDHWQEALRAVNRCPICDNSYQQEKARLHYKGDSTILVHITCEYCQSNFAAMVFSFGQGLSSVGAITDLHFDDLVRLYESPAIGSDEAIEAYQFLNSNNFLNSLLKV